MNKEIEKALIEQIKHEEHASRLYMAMASWCDTQGYPGAASFLYKQSDEERMHMIKIVNYLNDKDGHSTFAELPNPTAEYNSLKHLFEKVLEHEKFVTQTINKLYELSVKHKDYTTATFLQWFITEQIEEEKSIRDILDQMNLAGEMKSGLFHIDKELAEIANNKVIEPA